MAVGAEDAGAIGVIEQHELRDDLVLIGRDVARRRCTATASPLPALDVAEDLIVGAVLLDDVDDVLDQARLADALGDRPAAADLSRGGSRASAIAAAAHVRARTAAESFGSSLRRRQRHERQRAGVLMRVEAFDAGAVLLLRLVGQALDVGGEDRASARRRTPSRRETSRRESTPAVSIRPGPRDRTSKTAIAFCEPLAT